MWIVQSIFYLSITRKLRLSNGEYFIPKRFVNCSTVVVYLMECQSNSFFSGKKKKQLKLERRIYGTSKMPIYGSLLGSILLYIMDIIPQRLICSLRSYFLTKEVEILTGIYYSQSVGGFIDFVLQYHQV